MAKISVFNAFAFRAKVVCTSQKALYKEMEHINKALQVCSFSPWALNSPKKDSTINTTSTMKNHWQPTKQHQQQWIKQQKHLHSGTIHSRTWERFKENATTWGSRYTSKRITPLKPLSWSPKTATTNF